MLPTISEVWLSLSQRMKIGILWENMTTISLLIYDVIQDGFITPSIIMPPVNGVSSTSTQDAATDMNAMFQL